MLNKCCCGRDYIFLFSNNVSNCWVILTKLIVYWSQLCGSRPRHLGFYSIVVTYQYLLFFCNNILTFYTLICAHKITYLGVIFCFWVVSRKKNSKRILFFTRCCCLCEALITNNHLISVQSVMSKKKTLLMKWPFFLIEMFGTQTTQTSWNRQKGNYTLLWYVCMFLI